MTNIEYRKSISEVLDILEHTNKEDVEKISPKFIEFLNKNKCDNYKPTLDHSKRIKEMNLRETTIGILSIINSKFWCTPEQKELFDDMYVIFTDYTGSERSNIEESKRAKDPILFGALKIANQLSSRLYYIADWEDEFCDLTLDKLVKEFKDSGKESPVKDIIKEYPTIDSLRDSFKNYK